LDTSPLLLGWLAFLLLFVVQMVAAPGRRGRRR